MTRIKNIKRMFAYLGLNIWELLSGTSWRIAFMRQYCIYFCIPLLSLRCFFSTTRFTVFTRAKHIICNYFRYNRAGAIVILLGFISVAAMPSALLMSLCIPVSVFRRASGDYGSVADFAYFYNMGLGVNIFSLFTPRVSDGFKRRYKCA